MTELASAPIGSLVLDSRLISDPERVKSRFYSDFMAPQGLERGLYASVGRGRHGLLIASAQRGARRGDYEAHEIRLMKQIIPHLQRSFRTWQHVVDAELERQAAIDAMEHVTVGIALVDGLGKLHFANRIAEEQIRGGALMLAHGRLCARSPRATQALQEAIRGAVREDRPIADRVALPVAGAPSVSVLVSPLSDGPASRRHPGRLAMLLIGGEQRRAIDETAVAQVYGLTPAEARLLAALVKGEQLADYAARHKISATTAKTHLRAMFDKIGERRQADLIRRVVSDPALRA
jgi:DNA-binding CsgD family transcriptional regulator